MSIKLGLEQAIEAYNEAVYHLNQVLDMPDDVFPNIEGQVLTESEKKIFLLGIEYSLAALLGNLTRDEDSRD